MTFNTLKGLKNRGVKVELGFPYEMWDTPDAEVTRLKSRVRIQRKNVIPVTVLPLEIAYACNA